MKKADATWKYIGIGTAILVVIILIPVLLNYVLLCNTPRGEVIGEENGPTTWLGFWGTYIGAIATAIIAGVSYYQSKKESQRTSLRNQIEQERSLYKNLESLIEKEVVVHSVSRIYELAYSNTDNEYNILLSNIKTDLHYASLHCVTFHDVIINGEYMNFGNKLRELNLKVFDVVNAISTNRYENKNEDNKELYEQILSQSVVEIEDISNNLVHLGYKVLMAQNDKIVKLESKLQNS